MEIQKIKAELLNPAEYNPRKDLKPGEKEYEKLKRSILEFGYVEPVIWNKRTGNHCKRTSAAQGSNGYRRTA